MNRIEVLIIDDEKSARDLLRNLLQDVAEVRVIDEAGSVDKALPLVIKHRPDVLLLDIQMPQKDGFMLVEGLAELKIHPEIIFITAYDKYAIRAIKSSAVDYLLKPVKREELIAALQKAGEKLKNQSPEKQYSLLLKQLKATTKIKFKNRTGFSMVDVDDILFCEADSNYTLLQLDTGKKLTLSLNLGRVEEMLPHEKFCRISRSIIINLNYLAEVDRKAMTCEIVNDSSHTLSISRKQLKTLEERCESLFNIDLQKD